MNSLPAIAVAYLHRADAIASQIGSIKHDLISCLRQLIVARTQLDNAIRIDAVIQNRRQNAHRSQVMAAAIGHGRPLEPQHSSTGEQSRTVSSAEAHVTSCLAEMTKLLESLRQGAQALESLHLELVARASAQDSPAWVSDGDRLVLARAQANIGNRVVEAQREVQLKTVQWSNCPPSQYAALLNTWNQNMPDVRDRQMEDLADMMLS